MATDDHDDTPHKHTPGTHSLRIRNLPVAMARGAPATQTTLTQLIWQHTGIVTFNARTWHRWLTRRHDFAYGFVEVHSVDDGNALIHSAPNIITNRVPWEAEWCHDSFVSISADCYTLNNPEYPNLTFHQHHLHGTQRVVEDSTGLDLPWELWPDPIRPLIPPPLALTFNHPANCGSPSHQSPQ